MTLLVLPVVHQELPQRMSLTMAAAWISASPWPLCGLPGSACSSTWSTSSPSSCSLLGAHAAISSFPPSHTSSSFFSLSKMCFHRGTPRLSQFSPEMGVLEAQLPLLREPVQLSWQHLSRDSRRSGHGCSRWRGPALCSRTLLGSAWLHRRVWTAHLLTSARAQEEIIYGAREDRDKNDDAECTKNSD